MNTIKRFLVIAIGVLASLSIKGQDIHFSQFYMSPLNLNPALTGVMECNSRFVGNIRNQWASVLGSSAYNTMSFGYDQKVPVGRSDYFGIGGSVFGDIAGDLRFGVMQAKLHFAYTKKMAGTRKKSHYLSIGADIGFGQWAIRENVENWRWAGTSPGSIGGTDFLYGDISAGLLWFSNFDEKTSLYAGVAAAHLNQPNVSFNGSVENLDAKYTFHAGGTMPLGSSMSLVPNIVALLQGIHNQLNLGTSLRFHLGSQISGRQSWEAGLWYRLSNSQYASVDDVGNAKSGLHSDALIFATRFDTGSYGIGFSYDYNISKLQNGGTLNGSFELSLVYNICGSEKRGVYCPKF